MRKASIKQNHKDFEEKLDGFDNVAAQISHGASDIFAEGLVLVVAGYWEAVLDEDFVDALNRDTTAYAKRVGIELPKNLSRDICFGLLIGDRYLDFRDTAEIIGRARKVLV